MFAVPSPLREDPATLQQLVLEAAAEIERLLLQLAGLQRNRFGRRSERLDDETLQQGMEDLEQSLAEHEAGLEAAALEGSKPAEEPPQTAPPLTPPPRPRTEPAKRNRGALPVHLTREEMGVDVEDKSCPCCNGTLHLIGEDRSEMLDFVPAHVRVRVVRRPKYGCRACGEAVVQAPAPERPIDGGMATEALLAHVLVSKYADHLPLYRQSQIFARHGIALGRSTLCNWVGRACWWLAPLHELLLSPCCARLKCSLTTRHCRCWPPAAGAPRPGGCGADRAIGPLPICSEDRKGEHPAIHLKGFRGLLQADGYAGFGSLIDAKTGDGPRLVFCWAHTRRKFYDINVATQSPLAAEALRRIAALYAIEAEIRGKPAEERRQVRQQRSRPLVEARHTWLNQQLERVSGRSASAQAIRYALNHWDGLILFLEDGRLELDTNTVERAIRPVTLTRKNALFAGADVGASYCSSGDVLTKQGNSAADFERSGAVTAYPRRRGKRCPTPGRHVGLSRVPRRMVAGRQALQC